VKPWHVPAGAAALGAIVTVLDVVNVHSPLRALAAVAFVLLAPGAAWVGLLQIPDRAAEAAVAIGLSITVTIAIGLVQIYAGAWSPARTLTYLVALTMIGALLQIVPTSLLSPRGAVSPRRIRPLFDIAVCRWQLQSVQTDHKNDH